MRKLVVLASFVCQAVVAQPITINKTVLQSILDQNVCCSEAPGGLLSVTPLMMSGVDLASGVSNLQTGAKFDNAMRYRIGSNTKTFTATVILQLIEAGTKIPGTKTKFTLDSTAKQVLGAKAMVNVPYADIMTVKQLLNMTSGLYDYNTHAFRQLVYKNPKKAWTPLEILATMKGQAAYYKPGSTCAECGATYCASNPGNSNESNCYNYSDTNYIVLGMMIEKLTGDTAANQIQKRILTKLGLTNTSFPMTPSMGGKFAHGYVAEGVTTTCGPVVGDGYNDATTCFNPTSSWTAGAMISNIPDMKKWLTTLVTGKPLLSSAMQAKRLDLVWGNIGGVPVQYGLGIMQVGPGLLSSNQTFLGHGGEIWGFQNVAFQGTGPCGVKFVDVMNGFNLDRPNTTPYELTFLQAAAFVCGGTVNVPACTKTPPCP